MEIVDHKDCNPPSCVFPGLRLHFRHCNCLEPGIYKPESCNTNRRRRAFELRRSLQSQFLSRRLVFGDHSVATDHFLHRQTIVSEHFLDQESQTTDYPTWRRYFHLRWNRLDSRVGCDSPTK